MCSKEEHSRRAITDLYDENRRTFLVQYPVSLIITLSLTGFVVFMITGFLGYPDRFEPPLTQFLFSKPWPLFFWFCALIITLQVSILRHPSLRRQLIQTLSVTVLSMILLILIEGVGLDAILQALGNFIPNLNPQVLLRDLSRSGWTYTIINFGILGIYAVDSMRRWVRRAQGKPPVRGAAIGLNDAEHSQDMPTLSELVSGDLIVGALLTLLLSLILQKAVITFVAVALQGGTGTVSISECTLSWPVGTCATGAGLHDPPTLAFMDLILALLVLPVGLLILALTAVVAALDVLERRRRGDPNASASLISPRPAPTGRVTKEVAWTIFDALRAALVRRVHVTVTNIGGSLRTVAWPVLIFVGVVAVGGAARYIRIYLHLLSAQRTFYSDPTLYAMLRQYDRDLLAQRFDQHLEIVAPLVALLCGILAAVAIVLSAAFLLYRVRVAQNSLRFLGLVGFVVLLTFWIYSLALSGFNGLFHLLRNTDPQNFFPLWRVPFPQPGASTIISFAALVIAGIIVLVRRARGPRRTAPTPVQVTSAGDG